MIPILRWDLRANVCCFTFGTFLSMFLSELGIWVCSVAVICDLGFLFFAFRFLGFRCWISLYNLPFQLSDWFYMLRGVTILRVCLLYLSSYYISRYIISIVIFVCLLFWVVLHKLFDVSVNCFNFILVSRLSQLIKLIHLVSSLVMKNIIIIFKGN